MDFGDTRFGFVGGLILTGLILFFAVGFLLYLVDLLTRIFVKKSRQKAIEEISDSVKGSGKAAKYVLTDKGFRKDLRKEFRIEIILFSMLGLALLLAFLGVE
jgi:hypothetical protein